MIRINQNFTKVKKVLYYYSLELDLSIFLFEFKRNSNQWKINRKKNTDCKDRKRIIEMIIAVIMLFDVDLTTMALSLIIVIKMNNILGNNDSNYNQS